jgi:hypothetical protein
MTGISRRDFLKLGGLALGTLAFARQPFLGGLSNFSDASLLRVATKSLSVYKEASDKSLITGTWYRDELIHYYDEVNGVDGEPKHNPIWYRVWGGYLHRARLQRVKIIFNKPMDFIPEGTRQLAEVTVPFTTPRRLIKAGWTPEPLNPPLYYESVHWVDSIREGPDGTPWYGIFDELDSNVKYFVPAMHMRPIPHEDLSPISPDVPWNKKRIDVNLTTQMLTAFEYDKAIFQTKISSGIPAGDFKSPDGKFQIIDKTPSKHMGNSYFGLTQNRNLLADADGYVLPGVPWTCFFTEVGHAFHGTYWHENFGAPMSHGCINMRTSEARWLFRWVLPAHTVQELSTQYSFHYGNKGTAVNIFY